MSSPYLLVRIKLIEMEISTLCRFDEDPSLLFVFLVIDASIATDIHSAEASGRFKLRDMCH
jgi:hypothetical protein